MLCWCSVLVSSLLLLVPVQGFAFRELDLGSSTWKISNSNGSITLSNGTVPGYVTLDLHRAGLVADPYYRFSPANQSWIGLETWSYERDFILSDDFIQNSVKILLVAEGIDTVANISLNDGQFRASVENMHRRYYFDVTNAVHPGSNTLLVVIASAVKIANERAESYPYTLPGSHVLDMSSMQSGTKGVPNHSFVRKMATHFYWDGGPASYPSGIWRPIMLWGTARPILHDIVVQMKSKSTFVFAVNVTVYYSSPAPFEGFLNLTLANTTWSVPLSIKSSTLIDGSASTYVTVTLPATSLSLWFPNSHRRTSHAPTLHRLNVSLHDHSNALVANKTIMVGFRDIYIDERSLDDGKAFAFVVNGRPIFAKGANWMPADEFLTRSTDDDYAKILQSAADVGMNMIRINGHGIYLPNSFYDLTDRLGIMIWHDFAFSHSPYPTNSEFLDEVRLEVLDNVRRLSHHPSIVLWCGNNEIETGLTWSQEITSNPNLFASDYADLFLDVIHSALREVDQTVLYRSSSPTNFVYREYPYQQFWGDAQSQSYGDNHHYDYDSVCTDVTVYPQPRFQSEFGHISFSSLYTLSTVALPSDLSSNSTFLEYRMYHPNGNEQVTKQIGNFFRAPKDFDSFVYLSQATQALCIQSQVDHYRRFFNEMRTAGSLYWQLNDIWQVSVFPK